MPERLESVMARVPGTRIKELDSFCQAWIRQKRIHGCVW